MAPPTRLQREIAERLLQLIREDGLTPGAWLNENHTAKRLNVSRTPVRAALTLLEEQGVVRRHANKGIELISPVDVPAVTPATPDTLELALVRVAHDREAGALNDDVSETDLMRRYALSRPDLQKLLTRLAGLGMIARKPGYGWRFLIAPRDLTVHDEGYRFRLLIEPMALLEPGFHLDQGWIDEMRARHHEALTQPWRESAAVAFFEMNAAFHEGLAAASGNRFIHGAIRHQNELRRLSNYNWVFGIERVRINSTEHLQILDYLAAGDSEVAATLMRRHLQRAAALRDPGLYQSGN